MKSKLFKSLTVLLVTIAIALSFSISVFAEGDPTEPIVPTTGIDVSDNNPVYQSATP